MNRRVPCPRCGAPKVRQAQVCQQCFIASRAGKSARGAVLRGGANAAANRRRAQALEANGHPTPTDVCFPLDATGCADHPRDRHHWVLDDDSWGTCQHCSMERLHASKIEPTWRMA